MPLIVEVNLFVLKHTMTLILIMHVRITLPLLDLFVTESSGIIVSIDPSHRKFVRTHYRTTFLNEHETFRYITLPLDVVSFTIYADVYISYQRQKMVAIQSFEKVDFPKKI